MHEKIYNTVSLTGGVGLFLVLILSWSCGDPRGDTEGASGNALFHVSASGAEATGPYFTTDDQGFPVLVWNEKLDGGDSTGYVVRFAKFSKNGMEILSRGEVPPSRGCSTSSESMSKLAFRADGSIVAVYSRRQPTADNRFAGALYYTQSSDAGATWTPQRYLHVGDTTKGLSRSFFDIATLPDGEIGAIWLDSRLKSNDKEGSTLFFAKTSGSDGFLSDEPIAFGTCECCRTELFVSSSGDLHVLYRAIWQDSIRDIAHIISKDHGNSFSEPARISQDNWVIYGCPHTGPSVAETTKGLEMVWFTMGGEPGLYQTTYDLTTQQYSAKEPLTYVGRHPQVVAAGTQKVVYLWESSAQVDPHGGHTSHDGPAAGISIHQPTMPESILVAQVRQNGEPLGEIETHGNGGYMELPVGVDLGADAVGLAWVERDEEGGERVMYSRMMIEDL